MKSCKGSRLVRCPECGDTHLSFLETRRLTVYYRQVPEPPPSDKAARVLLEESEGSLYEEQTQAGYAEDVQGYCHCCGNKWKTPDCVCMDDLLKHDEPSEDEAESPVQEEAPEAEALSPEETPDVEALFPEPSPEAEPALPEEAAEPEPQVPEPEPEPEPPTPEPVPAPRKAPPQRKARKIKATDLINDIIAGVVDPQLMSKYNLSASQLEALLQRLVDKGASHTKAQIDARVNLEDTSITKAFVETQRSMQELDYAETMSVDPVEALAAVKKAVAPPPQPPKPKIKAKQFVKDVEARMSDPQLMMKYRLDERQLNSLFQRLVDLGMLSVELLYNRTSISETSITKAFVEVYASLQELEE